MKKTISLILSVLMLLTMLGGATVSAAVAESVTFTVDAERPLRVGDTATVTVSVTEDSYFTNATIYLHYDPAVVEYVSDGLGEIAPASAWYISNNFPEEGFVKAAYVTINGLVKGGELLTFRFRCIDSGTVDFRLTFDECVGVGQDGQSFPLNYTVVDANGVMAVPSFPDVPRSAWYFEAVSTVAFSGIMTGYKSGNFGPADNLQRQDFVVTLARLANADLTEYQGKTGDLNDVKASAYYAPAVAWAVDNGLITGYKSGNFGVGDSITREQVATILYRAAGQPPVADRDTILSAFPDAGKISPYAKDAMAWNVKEGILSGMKSGNISPVSGASRAQIATILMRMMRPVM